MKEKNLVLAHLVFVLTTIYVLAWLPKWPFSKYLFVGSFAFIVGLEVAYWWQSKKDNSRLINLGQWGSLKATTLKDFYSYFGVVLFAVLTLWLVGWCLGTLHKPGTGWRRVEGYFWSSMVQQFVLQITLLRRLLVLLPSKWSAILLASVCFAFVHAPNPVLTGLCIASGLLLCSLYEKTRNFWLCVAFHMALGLSLSLSMPEQFTGGMKAGKRYVEWVERQKIQNK